MFVNPKNGQTPSMTSLMFLFDKGNGVERLKLRNPDLATSVMSILTRTGDALALYPFERQKFDAAWRALQD